MEGELLSQTILPLAIVMNGYLIMHMLGVGSMTDNFAPSSEQ